MDLIISKAILDVREINSLFSAVNLALVGFPLTNALGENMPSHY